MGGCFLRVVCVLAGAGIGLVLAFLLVDPLCWLFGVRHFEGGSGYFIVFCVAPILTIVGLIAGVVVGAKLDG